MAPSPEYDKEPKAPDKTTTNTPCEETKVQHDSISEQQTNSDHKTSTTSANTDIENNKHVEALDDGQLRALLDEAITYKCPKDREGKSSLFKELLEEVEQDEQACEAAARSLGGCRGSKRGGRSRHALPHSNSLQDLVAALAAEPTRRHHARHATPAHTTSSVSARAIHGGSLPSGVDTSSLMSEEPARGAGYLATVRCVNPPPLAERRVSASDANAPHEMELLNRRSKPMFPMTYTARATLEIGSGSVCSGRAVTTTTASNQVDSGIPFSCITTPEVVATCNTTSSSQAAVAIDPKPLQLGSCYRAVASITGPRDETSEHCAIVSAPALDPDTVSALETASLDATTSEQPRSVISSSFNGLPLTRPNYGSTGSTAPDDYKKSFDENGNAVQGFSSPLAGSGQHKKPRRKKSSKNETVIDCRQIDGYQGDKDVNELLRFIESNAESARAPKLSRAKHRDDADDKTGKKRSSDRRKDKDKVKRASSLEELSRTTIEELTGPQPAPTPMSAAVKPERRSWGDTRDAPLPPASSPAMPLADPPDHPSTELTDFQTVTKKRKQRRRTDEPTPRRSRVPSPPSPPSPRAAHASDRSNDSNDDLDSVHSLPPAPPPSVPHASYAEIARTRHNIPDLIESCNFYAEGEGEPEGESEPARQLEPPPPPPPPDSEGYPALEPRVQSGPKRARDVVKQPQTNVRRDRKDRPPQTETKPVESPAPDVVADRRPPVILLDSRVRSQDMDGVTFGFDINEQLLGSSGRRLRCDLLRDAPDVGAGGVAVRAGCLAIRYIAPSVNSDSQHLHQIIDYVGNAWEDVIRCGTGKVRYYSE